MNARKIEKRLASRRPIAKNPHWDSRSAQAAMTVDAANFPNPSSRRMMLVLTLPHYLCDFRRLKQRQALPAPAARVAPASEPVQMFSVSRRGPSFLSRARGQHGGTGIGAHTRHHRSPAAAQNASCHAAFRLQHNAHGRVADSRNSPHTLRREIPFFPPSATFQPKREAPKKPGRRTNPQAPHRIMAAS